MRITWHEVGSRRYEYGVDRGILYAGPGQNHLAVPWNGLISVTEKPSTPTPEKIFMDGFKIRNEVGLDEYEGSIEAFTYPEVLEMYEGVTSPEVGLNFHAQARSEFHLSYRTKIGNDRDGKDGGYKIHLLYNVLAISSDRDRSTDEEETDPIRFTWDFVTRPMLNEANLQSSPVSYLTIDSTKTHPLILQHVENILYGTGLTDPRIPPPEELITIFSTSPPSHGYGLGPYGHGTYGGTLLSVDPVDPPPGPPANPLKWNVESGAGLTIVSDYDYNTFPDAVLTSDPQVLMVAFSQYHSHYGPGGTGGRRSTNMGLTWTPASGHTGLTTGSPAHQGVVGMATRGSDIFLVMVNQDPPARTAIFRRSTNRGLTWGSQINITGWNNEGWIYPADISWINDGTSNGRLIVTSYGPDGVLLMFSSNLGTSWTRGPLVKKGDVWQDATESCIVQLPSGELLIAIRNDTTRDIEIARSSNYGTTWSTPLPLILNASGLPRMTVMGDGSILMTLRDASDVTPTGGWMYGQSVDLGHTWTTHRFSDDRMMYGRFINTGANSGLLIGASDHRVAYGGAWVFMKKLNGVTP